jgi:Sugar (and other) transporter
LPVKNTLAYFAAASLTTTKERRLTPTATQLGAAVSSFNLSMTFLVLKFFTTIYMSIGFHGLFWIYAVFSLAGGIFGYIFIPETKGKTLKEIEAHFVGNAPVESPGTV